MKYSEKVTNAYEKNKRYLDKMELKLYLAKKDIALELIAGSEIINQIIEIIYVPQSNDILNDEELEEARCAYTCPVEFLKGKGFVPSGRNPY